jgi:[ribosomal protein S5]-alanine N-acetyltransferase
LAARQLWIKQPKNVLAGLKYFREPLNNHSDIYELGYRFKQKHWSKGYATEASSAILNYGFEHFNMDAVYAITNTEHKASMHVLTKLGFELKEVFDYDGEDTNWFELRSTEWKKSNNRN